MLFIMSLNFTERGIRENKDDPAAGVALQKTAASRASDGPRAALFVTETSRSVEELDACFVVRDASEQKLGYFYYEEEARVGKPRCADNLQPSRIGTLADRGQRREAAGVVAEAPRTVRPRDETPVFINSSAICKAARTSPIPTEKTNRPRAN
jgi:hypothetical protein